MLSNSVEGLSVRLYLQRIAASGDEQAELLLNELEVLGIEQAYEDAITEGVIAAKGGTLYRLDRSTTLGVTLYPVLAPLRS